jgi:hypothetical protein
MILYFESHLSKQQKVSETKLGSEKVIDEVAICSEY